MDKSQDNIDVMDHQVQNNADINASCFKGRKPVDLYKAGISDDILYSQKDRVEPFNMADLKDNVLAFFGL